MAICVPRVVAVESLVLPLGLIALGAKHNLSIITVLTLLLIYFATIKLLRRENGGRGNHPIASIQIFALTAVKSNTGTQIRTPPPPINTDEADGSVHST